MPELRLHSLRLALVLITLAVMYDKRWLQVSGSEFVSPCCPCCSHGPDMPVPRRLMVLNLAN
jgi:hypothetical protein